MSFSRTLFFFLLKIRFVRTIFRFLKSEHRLYITQNHKSSSFQHFHKHALKTSLTNLKIQNSIIGWLLKVFLLKIITFQVSSNIKHKIRSRSSIYNSVHVFFSNWLNLIRFYYLNQIVSCSAYIIWSLSLFSNFEDLCMYMWFYMIQIWTTWSALEMTDFQWFLLVSSIYNCWVHVFFLSNWLNLIRFYYLNQVISCSTYIIWSLSLFSNFEDFFMYLWFCMIHIWTTWSALEMTDFPWFLLLGKNGGREIKHKEEWEGIGICAGASVLLASNYLRRKSLSPSSRRRSRWRWRTCLLISNCRRRRRWRWSHMTILVAHTTCVMFFFN